MLLNEFLKEHAKLRREETTVADVKVLVATQQGTIAQQRSQINELIAGMKAQASQLEKVNAQVAAQQIHADLVINNP